MSTAHPPTATDPERRPGRPGLADWCVFGFTLLSIGAAILPILRTGNTEFLLYVVVMVVLLAVVTAVHLRVGFSLALLWCLSLWGILHMAGGLMPVPKNWPINGDVRVLYSLWLIPDRLKYDQLVHAYGFGITTWACWQALRAGAGVSRPTLGLMVLCGAAGMGFGALNEVIEFIATLLVPKTNVGGYVNTGWDLVSNLVGSAIAGLLIGLRGQGRARAGSSS